MALPLPQTSILESKARALQVDPFKSPEAQRLNLYLQTLSEICDLFYEFAPIDFKEKFVSTLSDDLGKVIKGLRGIKRTEKAKEYIEHARTELGVASSLFDDSEEADSAKRIRDRLRALNICKNFLEKAIHSNGHSFKETG